MRDRPYIVRFIAVALLLYSLWSLASVRQRVKTAEKEFADLDLQYTVLCEENRQLSASLGHEPDDGEIEALARERLGLVMPDDKIFYFTDR